jgi:hypothetical protein
MCYTIYTVIDVQSKVLLQFYERAYPVLPQLITLVRAIIPLLGILWLLFFAHSRERDVRNIK